MTEPRPREEPVGTLIKPLASTRVRLTYADCDPAGIVYFAAWFPWMERVLSSWLYDQGFRPDRLMENHGFGTVIRQAECEYLHPADLFDEIDLSLDSATFGQTSVQWGFTMIRRNDGIEVGRGRMAWVTVDGEGRPVSVPERIRAAVAGA